MIRETDVITKVLRGGRQRLRIERWEEQIRGLRGKMDPERQDAGP
jgi:hypothetical protein